MIKTVTRKKTIRIITSANSVNTYHHPLRNGQYLTFFTKFVEYMSSQWPQRQIFTKS